MSGRSHGRSQCLSHWLRVLLHDRLALGLQKNAEGESVRDQQDRYEKSRDEVRRSQLPGQEPRGVALVERVQKVERAPDIEYPCDDEAGPTWQHEQSQQRECCCNEVSIGLGPRERSGQV